MSLDIPVSKNVLVLASCGATMQRLPEWSRKVLSTSGLDLLVTSDPKQRKPPDRLRVRDVYSMEIQTFDPKTFGDVLKSKLRENSYDTAVVLMQSVNHSGYENVIRSALTVDPGRIILLDKSLSTRELHPFKLHVTLALDPAVSTLLSVCRRLIVLNARLSRFFKGIFGQ